MTFVAHDKLPELLTRYISEKIIRNEYKPGERILEAKLAEEMGVSRSPVREALRILEKNRLVELLPRKGARVTAVTAQHIEWFYDIFEALYGMVARRAAQHASARDLGDLHSALKKIEQAAAKEDVHAYYDSIFEFAAVGMKAARNPLLEQMLLELWPSTRRIQYASLMDRGDDLKKNVTYFQRVAKCAEEGKGEEAVAVVHEYADNERRFALKITNGKKQPD